MKKTGTLSINAGVSELDGTLLALEGAGAPLDMATDFLARLGLSSGDLIWVTGTKRLIGPASALFITNVGRAGLATAGGLGGDIVLGQGRVKCKACGFINKLNFIDPNHLPDCQNSAPPVHTLDV